MQIAKYALTIAIIMGFGCFHNGNCNNLRSRQTIVFMRHGEKPVRNLFCSFGQLTCQGLNRALALPQLLHSRFGKPDFIFAPNPAKKILDGCIKSYSYVRPLATIEPTAIQYNMPVNTPLGYSKFIAMGDLLLSPPYRNSTIFVAWEHVKMYLMVTTMIGKMGGNPTSVPIWTNDDYDSLYILTIDWKNGRGTVKFRREYQGLDDKSMICPSAEKAKTVKQESASPIKTIFIIPSAETDGVGELNCMGINRSLDLKDVLHSANPKIGLDIDYFFAAAPGLEEPFYYHRSLMTLEPTAISQSKPLRVLFNYDDSAGMAEHIAKETYRSSTLAIAWDPSQIQQLATLIYTHSGGNSADIPPGNPDFDTIYKITIAENESPTFQTISEGLAPLSVCPLPIRDSH